MREGVKEDWEAVRGDMKEGKQIGEEHGVREGVNEGRVGMGINEGGEAGRWSALIEGGSEGGQVAGRGEMKAVKKVHGGRA